jgi:hypothetical protein
MYEIHMFNASAVATSVSTGAYRPGDRHAVLAFVRQAPDSDHDWDQAEGQLNSAGWTQVRFSGAGTLVAEDLTGNAAHLLDAYQAAGQDGFGFVVYEKPMSEDDE